MENLKEWLSKQNSEGTWESKEYHQGYNDAVNNVLREIEKQCTESTLRSV